jgi:uncharacterized glyoxalase superfamily protein PhnB
MSDVKTAVPSVWACLHYRDPRTALGFLTQAFGFTRRAVYAGEDGTIHHAELTWASARGEVGGVMFGASEEAPRFGAGLVHVVVDDPDDLCRRAEAAGATIVRQPEDTGYGSRMFVATDPEGNTWSFGTWHEA